MACALGRGIERITTTGHIGECPTAVTLPSTMVSDKVMERCCRPNTMSVSPATVMTDLVHERISSHAERVVAIFSPGSTDVSAAI